MSRGTGPERTPIQAPKKREGQERQVRERRQEERGRLDP